MGEFARIAASRIVLRAGPQSIHENILFPLDSSIDEAYSLLMTLSARNRLEGEVVEISSAVSWLTFHRRCAS